MVPPSIVHSVDIHGFGAEISPELPGLLHTVVNEGNTREFYKINLHPGGASCNEISYDVKTITCRDIYGNTVKYKHLI